MVYLLFFIHIMLFVVEILEIMITVVLLYKYTHYPLRGGTSHHGANSGAFSVGASADISAAICDRGAALSFKFYFYL